MTTTSASRRFRLRKAPEHIDIKHLPKLQASGRERRKRYLFVAIGRRSRSVHLAVKDDETEKSAIAFLREAARAFPFRLTHVLTDNGSCLTPAFAKACVALGAEYRHTRPRTLYMWTAPPRKVWRWFDQIACVHMSGLLSRSHMNAG